MTDQSKKPQQRWTRRSARSHSSGITGHLRRNTQWGAPCHSCGVCTANVQQFRAGHQQPSRYARGSFAGISYARSCTVMQRSNGHPRHIGFTISLLPAKWLTTNQGVVGSNPAGRAIPLSEGLLVPAGLRVFTRGQGWSFAATSDAGSIRVLTSSPPS